MIAKSVAGTCILFALLGFTHPALAVEPVTLSPAAVEGPRIYTPKTVHEFGEVDAAESLKCRFPIRNTGQATLLIEDVKTGCGCTVAQVPARSLEPGEETYLEAAINLRGRNGTQQTLIAVESNDPETPVSQLEITATVAPAIGIDPKVVDFGELMDDREHTKEVRLLSSQPDITFHILSVQVSGAGFEVGQTEISPGKEYNLTVRVPGPLSVGSHYGVIEVRTDLPHYQSIQINVRASAVGNFRVEPPTIKLPRAARAVTSANRLLRFSGGRVQDFKLINVVVPVPTMQAEIVERRDNEYHIRLLNLPLDGSLAGKQLLLQTDHPHFPEIRVPFEVLEAELN